MANNLGSLVVSLGLDAAEFTRGMTKGEYQAKQSVDRMKRDFDGLVKYVAGLGIGAALVQTVKSTADASKEIDRLAKLSATSAANFQAQAYAAQQAGISQEKLADIFKDTQDKVGDFLQNGAGPLKDFFDNIAPRVGVTADQFKNLSGPDALQLYVSSLEKANLSQSELTFYLEAIASDSALLLPLLKGNGAEMARLADEAQRLGKVMDDETIQANKRFADQIDRLESSMQGLQRTIGSAVIPWITRLSDEFQTGMKYANGFFDAIITFGGAGSSTDPAAKVREYTEELGRLKKARDDLISREGQLANTSGFDRQIETAQKRVLYFTDLMRMRWDLSGQRMGANDPRAIGATPTAETVGYRPPPAKPLPKPPGGSLPASVVRPDLELDAISDQFDQLYRTSEERQRLAARIIEQTRTPLEQLAQTEAELQMLRRAGLIDEETLARARFDAAERYEATLEKSAKQVKKVSEQAQEAAERARRLGDAFAGTFASAFDKGMKLGDLLKRLAFDAINIQFLTPAAQKAGNWLGSAVSSLFSFDGGGYTGSGSRSGGMDGKGGFLAMLHPNETVVDHSRGQGLGGGGVVINYSIDARGADAGVEERLRAALAESEARTRAAIVPTMVSAVKGSTGVARAMRGG